MGDDVAVDKKIKSILIVQPAPLSGKSPYYDLADKYDFSLTFQPFTELEGLDTHAFRKSRITLTDYSAIIFTSRNAIDHFFRISESLRIKMSQETKYFCSSEAIALYLQKYTQYRKRKVFFGDGSLKSTLTLMLKYKESDVFLLPCSDMGTTKVTDFLNENQFKYKQAVLYKTVFTPIYEEQLDTDMIVFFSPSSVQALFHRHPTFKQENRRIAAFGSATCKAVEQAGLSLDIKAPTPETKSMSLAIKKYLDR